MFKKLVFISLLCFVVSSLGYEINDEAKLADALKKAGDKLVVIDFFAQWCPPCKFIAPYIDRLSEELKDDVVFIKVDVDKAKNIKKDYNIRGFPTFVFIKNGKKVEQILGADLFEIKKAIKNHSPNVEIGMKTPQQPERKYCNIL